MFNKIGLSFGIMLFTMGCGVYSFTGAAIEGKTINIHFIENNARNIAPSLSATFTAKLREKIQVQSALTQLNTETTDYIISGSIKNYEVTVAALQGVEIVAKNRLTIGVEIQFENKLDQTKNFTQTFTRFADFDGSQTLQAVETRLINTISDQLTDDIFNRAFVNW